MSAIPKPRREADEPYKQWICTFPCLAKGRLDECEGPVDPDHTTPRSLGGSDRTCLPLCRKHHNLANRRRWFEARYAIIFKYEVEKYNRLYDSQHPHSAKRECKPKVKVFRKKDVLRALVVLDPDGQLVAYGNDSGQFQLPVFYSKRDAENWRDEAPLERGKIGRCQIKLEGVK